MDKLQDAISSFTGNDNNNRNSDSNNNDGNFQGGSNNHEQGSNSEGGSGGGFLSSIQNKINSAAGGGRESEQNEDYLDKGVDYVQEKFMGQGPQDNESAVEQAKDEQISDFIRDKYKSATGGDFPIQDKETRLG